MKTYLKLFAALAMTILLAGCMIAESSPEILPDPAVPDDGDLLAMDEQVPLNETPGNIWNGEEPEEPAVLDEIEEADPYEGLNETQIAYVEEVLALVNEARAEAGVAPLVLDHDLRKAAQIRAAECVKTFSHTRPDGSSYKTAIAEAGVESRYTGENVATGYTSARQVVAGWMRSQGHRANILNENFTKIGIGLEKNSGNRYRGYAWTQLFVK